VANQKADDFVLRHQHLVPVIRSVGEQLQSGQTKWDLQQAFRMSDTSGQGLCGRDDFINAVFD